MMDYLYIAGWVVYCSLEGIAQGALFSHNKANCNGRYPFNIHRFLILPRGAAWFAFSGLGFALAANMFMFSFFHNGFYYETRRRLEPESKELLGYTFWGKSTTTTAKINTGFWLRVAGLIAGISVHILSRLI